MNRNNEIVFRALHLFSFHFSSACMFERWMLVVLFVFRCYLPSIRILFEFPLPTAYLFLALSLSLSLSFFPPSLPFTISFFSCPFCFHAFSFSLPVIASALSPSRSSITLHKCIFHSFYGEWDYTKDKKHESDMRLVDVWIDVSEMDSIKGKSTTIKKNHSSIGTDF